MLLLSTLGVGSSSCGDPSGPDSLPVRLTTLYNGPAASNMDVPAPTAQVVSAGVLRVEAAAGFGQSGHSLSATASLAKADAAPASLRVVVNSKSPQNGLQILWLIVYEVEVTGIPAGSYDLTLVRVDDDRPQPRIELRQTVAVP
ncbi:MAG: hypothetical protein ACT4P6_09325 [Gemmatimonadaceae bacterium]